MPSQTIPWSDKYQPDFTAPKIGDCQVHATLSLISDDGPVRQAAAPHQQSSLADPDSRSMATSGRGSNAEW
jgi:hypothetical protein